LSFDSWPWQPNLRASNPPWFSQGKLVDYPGRRLECQGKRWADPGTLRDGNSPGLYTSDRPGHPYNSCSLPVLVLEKHLEWRIFFVKL
jgi:hypothetical protein